MNYFRIAIVVLCFSSCADRAQDEAMPNVIVILTDDQGWGDLSVHGNINLETPHIDAMAANGASFDHFYVSPVCSPTRAEFLTGRYHPRGGVHSTSAGGERLDLDETTIAQVFKKAGYATAAYGKWHNGMQPPYHPNARGFDDFYGFCSGHWGHYFSPMLEHNGALVSGNGYLIDDFTDHALAFIDSHADAPFFLYLPYNTPHSPMQVPDTWFDRLQDQDISMRHRDPEREDLQFTRAALAMCENIDWNIGRVMEKVGEMELMGNTIFVFFCDNGPNSWRWNGGMKGRKGSTDEGGVRSPLFIQWTGTIAPGGRVADISGAIDLLPTLADLAGIEYAVQKPLDGLSLKPLLLRQAISMPERYIFSHWRGKVSVRSQQYRLDHNNRLYNMEDDPGQYTAINAEVPDVARTMEQAKAAWQRQVLAELKPEAPRPFPVGCPGYTWTQLPARDAVAHGNIRRSNRFPNCSFFTNWIDTGDSITWHIDVMESAQYEVQLYYTCAEKDLGSNIVLQYGEERLVAKVTEAHDPPLVGMQRDRIPRQESYVKDFRPWIAGRLFMEEGTGMLSLKALDIPGNAAMDLRLIMLRKL